MEPQKTVKLSRKYYFIPVVGGIIAILLLSFLLYWYVEVYGAETVAVETANPRECMAEINASMYAAGAAILGDAYFGGDRGYNLRCARAAYVRALSINMVGDAQAWHQLGRIDFLEGKFDDAIDKFESQIEFFGDTLPNVHYMLGLTYGYRARAGADTADWQRSEESFKKYLEFDPVSPWARTDLAWVLFSLGKYEEMKPVIEKGLETNPRHPWLLNMYGLSLLNTGEPSRAHTYFVDALSELAPYTGEDWGKAYPGNDPKSWDRGLTEMRSAIEQNIAISAM